MGEERPGEGAGGAHGGVGPGRAIGGAHGGVGPGRATGGVVEPPGGSGGGPAFPRELLPIGAAVAVMIAIVLLVGPRIAGRAQVAEGEASPVLRAPERPIPAEADVFRLSAAELAVDPAAERRSAVHPRTLETYRALRAYPGAPPRIPHGLTPEEYRDASCNTCHERGGFVARFSAYAPVTPHPEYANCLQCHVPDDAVVGRSFPDPASGANATCLQCHAVGRPAPAFAETDWRPAAWPEIGERALPGSPPIIPHDLELRGNCLACHAGPHAVAEIRTTHPERANCRQCHVPAVAPDEPAFSRPLDPVAGGGEEW